MLILLLIIFLIFIIWFVNRLKQRYILRLFRDNSIQVAGSRGSGKDCLFNFVISRSKPQRYKGQKNKVFRYISQLDYAVGKKHVERIPFDPCRQFNLGGNTSSDFIEGKYRRYEYPYPDKIDYFISDVGVYFPSQEQSMLCRKYPSFPLFQALLRHLGDSNLHTNSQTFQRPWDKIREQFELYIYTKKCKVFFGKFVHQVMYVYERYDAACQHVKPFKRMLGRTARIERQKYLAQYGDIRRVSVWYKMKYKYNSRVFKEILLNGTV